MEAVPQLFITNDSKADTAIRIATTSTDSPVIFCADLKMGAYNYAYFKMSPLLYNVESKQLFFVKETTISLPPTPTKVVLKDERETKPIGVEKIKQMVINPEDVEKYYPEYIGAKDTKWLRTLSEPVDYLIVTSNALKSKFEEYAKWKRRRGLHTKIITVEDIYLDYPSTSHELSIKNALYSYYYQNGLKYVLLGGLPSIVPSLMCQIKTKVDNVYLNIDTPTDLYYACFGGCFNWDYNNNGIYGETSDYISLVPNIYVSRLPVTNQSEIGNYLDKLKTYEQSNKPFHSILQAAYGVTSTPFIPGYPDLHTFAKESDALWNNYIYLTSYWFVVRDYIYDFSSNISGYSNVSPYALYDLINSNNYHYVDINCHADATNYIFGVQSYYTYFLAQSQNNSIPALFTSGACNTAAFDSSNCLADLLLCSQHGAIVYYGSSRDGWSTSSAPGPSTKYLGEFYKKQILNQPSAYKNRFAAVVAESKSALINEASTDNEYRWLQFSMNPLGDPELQIQNNLINNIYGYVSCEGNSITVSSGATDSCTIALISCLDDGDSYFSVVHNVSSYTFDNVTTPVYAAITKDNCIPYYSKPLITLSSIEGKTIVCDTASYSVDWIPIANAGYHLYWSLEDAPCTLTVDPSNHNKCMIENTSNSPMDGYIVARLSSDSILFSSTIKKRIVTHPAFSVSCSQGAGSSNGNTYPAQSNIPYNANQGFIVNPCCEITLTSPNFKCMQASFSGVSPTTFTFDGDQNEAKFTLPYQSTPYTCYFNGTGDGSCNNFSIKMTVSPTPIPVLDMRTNWAGTTLNAIMGYFDAQDLTSLMPITPYNNWNLWVYKADSGITMFNGNVNGLKSFDTSSWASGVYVIRGVAEGQTFTKVYNH